MQPSKDLKIEVKVSHQEGDVEADMEIGRLDGDVASIQTKPKEAEQAMPTSMQAEQMSPIKPNPKERLAGGFPVSQLQQPHLQARTISRA